MGTADIKTKKTTITLDATSGVHDQSFTGFGFQPKGIIVWGTLQTALNTYNEGISTTYGFSDGTNNNCIAVAKVDAVSTMDDSCMLRNDACIELLSTAAGNAEIVRAKVKTFDSDGLTLSYLAKTDTNQYILHVMAFGGADLSIKAKVETSGRTTTGTQAYTGYGFQPDVIFLACANNVTQNTLTAGGPFSIGAAITSVKTFCTICIDNDNVAANTGGVSSQTYYNNRTLVSYATANALANFGVTLLTLDSDGYTLTHNSAAAATTYPFIALAIKGGYWDFGNFTQKTSAGTTTFTGTVTQKPVGFFVFGQDLTTANTQTTTQNTDIGPSIGASDGTNEGYILFGSSIINSPTRTAMISSTAKVVRNATINATATSTALTAEADADLSVNGQATLNYTTADATARLCTYILLQKDLPPSGQNVVKSLTETISISESLAKIAAKNRAPAAETITISGSVARLGTKTRALTETTSVTATVLRLKTRPRTLTETIAITGTPTRLTTKNRQLTETIAVTATVARTKNSIKPLSGTVAVTSSLARLVTKIRTLSESIAVTATLVKSSGKNKALTESTTITGTPTRLTTKVRSLTESIAVTGSLTRAKNKLKTLTESIAITGTVTRLTTKVRTATESISVTGTPTRSKGRLETLTETIAITGTVNRLIAKIRALPTETVAVSGSLARSKGSNKTLSEAISLAGSVTRLAAKTRTLAESIGITAGTPTRLQTKIRSFTESISITGTVTQNVGHGAKQITKFLSETITITDNLARQLTKNRSISQTITITDAATRLTTKVKSISQTITITGSVTQTLTHGAKQITRFLSESIAITDSITRTTNKLRTISESITLTGTPTRQTTKVRTASDTITFTDAVTRTITQFHAKVMTLVESITITDSLARQAAKKRTASDSISITANTPIKSRIKIRNVPAETISLAGNVARKAAKWRPITQVISIYDLSLQAFKNGIQLLPPATATGGQTVPYKKPDFSKYRLRIKQILYPVYTRDELLRIERLRKLQQYKPIAIIPAFEQEINKVVAPFVVTDPIQNRVYVKFAAANAETPIRLAGTILVKVASRTPANRIVKGYFIASQKATPAMQKQTRKMQKLAKLMAIWSAMQTYLNK